MELAEFYKVDLIALAVVVGLGALVKPALMRQHVKICVQTLSVQMKENVSSSLDLLARLIAYVLQDTKVNSVKSLSVTTIATMVCAK